MDLVDRVNQLLDSLPRTRIRRLGREVPAFRACGIAGFHLAVVVTLATGLARGRSPAVLAALAAVCGLSFFAYAFTRRRLTGREELVLLEHVWFALACSAGALLVMGEPPLGYLDAVVSGLAFFLAAGRLGCTLVGCCHGFPSSIGIRYGPGHVRDGFSARWVGVRLFPVQLVELAALLVIGTGAVLFTLLGPEGGTLCFFLFSYAVIRFGLEGLRADVRPHLLGVSQARWMAVAEVATAVVISERAGLHPAALALLGACLAVWLLHAARVSLAGAAARALRPEHLSALREAAALAPAPPDPAARSALGFGVSASASPRGLLVSLSGPGDHLDLPLLCRVAAGAFPDLHLATAVLGAGGVLLFEVPGRPRGPAATPSADLGALLYAEIARAGQATAAEVPAAPAAASPAAGAPTSLRALRRAASAGSTARAGYFAPGPAVPGSPDRSQPAGER